ncbi:MAG TPA: hypothetical protein VM101_10980 [Flavitalea sp.]|nr:hypothetical protein [Flavitalea sp.]
MGIRIFIRLNAFAFIFLYSIYSQAQNINSFTEPNVQVGMQWWGDMPNVWTPVGWKNHLFRFNVVHNGIIIADPHPMLPVAKKHTAPYEGLGIQVAITPTSNDNLPPSRTEPYRITDMNANMIGNQGWAAHETPLLWTDWRQPHYSLNGITMRQEMFGHVSGGSDVKRGDEPLFGWVRISIPEKLELVSREKVGFFIKVNAPHTDVTMWSLDNLILHPAQSSYPRKLTFEKIGENDHPGGLLTESAGSKIRIAVLPGKADSIVFFGKGGDEKDYYIYVIMPAKKGAYVDLLLPFLPTDRAVAETEMKMGYDAALAESDHYWSEKPTTAAEITTPEPLINDLLKMAVKLQQITAEKNPETGQYEALLGSYAYSSIWATPNAMMLRLVTDPLGDHAVAERYLKIYKDAQGSSKAPGPSYKKHPGYLSAPRSVSSIDWMCDHGAVLDALSQHALITGDKHFIDEYIDVIIRGCEFIRDARRITDHKGIKGLLPPAVATDRDEPEQAVWNDGWAYKGLTSAVKLLHVINHPRANEFEAEAADYKKVFTKALREKAKTMPVWQDAKGNSHNVVPTAFLNGIENDPLYAPFYLDGGPLFLVYSGLIDANDTLMRNCRLYFREGPNTRTFDPLGNSNQMPVLTHEMSSCEPGLSWNVYHSWQTADRMKYLEGMYSLITGSISRQTFVGSEWRAGISGLFVTPIMIDMIRLAVIDDQIENDRLHLLRLTPLAWITKESQTSFNNIPTQYGPVSLNFQLSSDNKTLKIFFSGQWRNKPGKIIMHIPPVAGLQKVQVNGKNFPVKQEIEL